MKSAIEQELKTVIDPELGVNIFDLGLVYGIDFDDDGNVDLQLTMTSPLCPLIPVIEKGARYATLRVEGVTDVDVEIVWDPPWTPEKMSQEAKLQLGMAGAIS